MRLVLCAREEPGRSSLTHYRVGGEKTGIRRWQNKNGSYTPEGYKHYAEMYGWGKARGEKATVEKKGKKADSYDGKNPKVQNAAKTVVKKNSPFADSFGNLTKEGIRKIEDSSRTYLNPSWEEQKAGTAKEREKISKEDSSEWWDLVNKGMDPDHLTKEGLQLWNKYKDEYADATLRDLRIPITDKNREIVKQTFAKYDASYDLEALDKAYSSGPEEVDRREKEFSDRWNNRNSSADKFLVEKIRADVVGNSKTTDQEKRGYVRDAYTALDDGRLMKSVKAVLESSNNKDVQSLRQSAKEYQKTSGELDNAFIRYSEEYEKDHRFNGDGAEMGVLLEKTYPEYARLSKEYERKLKQCISDASKAAKDSKIQELKEFKKYKSFFEKIVDPKTGDPWYKAADVKAYVVAIASGASRWNLFPEIFIESFDNGGNKLPSMYL